MSPEQYLGEPLDGRADIFSLGVRLYELLHVPGMVFVAAAILAWGRVAGFGVALLAAVVSASVSFFVVRGVGGKALAGIDRPFVRRPLSRLHARPIVTVILLRAVFWVSPPLNYALAMTDRRFRNYPIGSAIGLAAPLLLAAAFVDWLFT